MGQRNSIEQVREEGREARRQGKPKLVNPYLFSSDSEDVFNSFIWDKGYEEEENALRTGE